MATGRASLFTLAVLVSSTLHAATGAPAWFSRYAPEAPGTGNQDPLAARVLADQSFFVAVRDKFGISCLRYDASGALISSATVYPPFAAVSAAISAFGEVVVLAQAPTHAGDFWTMKYDGTSGKAAWRVPAIFDGVGSGTDNPVAVAIDGAGDVVVTGAAYNGTDYDWATLKYSGDAGTLLWGPVVMNRPGVSADTPALLGIDPFGDVVVSGFSEVGSAPYDWVTTKYSGASGAVVWGPVVFDGADHQSDFPDAIAFDASGNVIVTGETGTTAGNTNWATVKYAAATGAVLWGPAIFVGAGGGDDKPAAAAVDGHGDVAVTGRTWNGTDFDWATIKYAGGTGAVLWGPVILSLSSGSEDYPLAIASDAAGHFLATGYSLGTSYDWVTIAYDGDNGNVLWGPKVFAGAAGGDDFPRAFALDASGNAIVSGVSSNGLDNDAVAIAYSGADGSHVWGPVVFNGIGGIGAFAPTLAADASGNVIVAGSQGGQTDGPNDVDWFVAKYDGTTGAVLWGPVRYDGATHEDDRVVAVKADGSGNVIVTGSTSHSGNYDWATFKYDGATGNVLWGPVVFDGGGGSIDVPTALAVDAAGDVVITGYSYGGSLAGSPTIKYSGASGAVIWGPEIFNGTPAALACDASGTAIVTGTTFNGSDDDWATIAYHGADGSILWGPVAYAGQFSGSSDSPTALVVTTAGRVVVTGIQSGPAGGVDFDWATLAYDAATGALLWGPETVGGNASRRDVPAAIASDASGDVVVTGSIINLAPSAPDFVNVNPDWATIKYDGSTGATLWGPIDHDGLLHLYDAPSAVALDASGNAIVAGVVTGRSNTFDEELVKYRAADGVALWQGVIYDSGGADQPFALAALGADAIVTGTADSAVTTIRFTEALAIDTLTLPPAGCGDPYDGTLSAANGTPPYSWTVVSGALPPGLSLGAGTGQVTGTPNAVGSFAFRVRVTDASSTTADRDFVIDTFPGPGVNLAATADPICPGSSSTLSVGGTFASYLWLPGGETTPTITVSPTQATFYGVTVTDGSGCERRGSLVLDVAIADAPSPLVTVDGCVPATTSGLTASTPTHTCNTYAWTVVGGTLDSGQGTSAITFTSGPAGTLVTIGVTETNSLGAVGQASGLAQADFADVPPGGAFAGFICTIARNGVTAGCGGGNYCPDAPVSRSQMAVFLLKAEHGSSYVPPPCTGVFADVACPGAFAVDWIEQLFHEGVTGGCGGGDYCPDSPVTRAQMAVFLLKTHLGPGYVPPPAVGIFGDVPIGAFAADWIEALYNAGITGGCSANPLLYCPNNPNTRGQMAVFIVKTFGLQ